VHREEIFERIKLEQAGAANGAQPQHDGAGNRSGSS
jgi:sRNA-binding carbon storage regulator CsrA